MKFYMLVITLLFTSGTFANLSLAQELIKPNLNNFEGEWVLDLSSGKYPSYCANRIVICMDSQDSNKLLLTYSFVTEDAKTYFSNDVIDFKNPTDLPFSKYVVRSEVTYFDDTEIETTQSISKVKGSLVAPVYHFKRTDVRRIEFHKNNTLSHVFFKANKNMVAYKALSFCLYHLEK